MKKIAIERKYVLIESSLMKTNNVSTITLLVLFISLLRCFINTWLPDIVNMYKELSNNNGVPKNSATKLDSSIDDEVNNLVGWALFKVMKKYNKELETDIDANEIDNQNVMDILNDIKFLSRDILNNKEYTRLYCPTDFAIRNKGYLTLISEHYIAYFSKISKYITYEVESSQRMHQRRDRVTEIKEVRKI